MAGPKRGKKTEDAMEVDAPGEAVHGVEFIRSRVHVQKETVTNVSSTDFPGAYPGEDLVWNHEKFVEVRTRLLLQYKLPKEFPIGDELTVHLNLKLKIHRLTDVELEFDLVGVDASISNAIRRYLIAEVPSMAIDIVYMFKNSSVLPDEVLSHRLGLVPINVDARTFQDREPNEDPTDLNTLVFEMKVKCESIKTAGRPATGKLAAKNTEVLSSDLQWIPQGIQQETFRDNPVKPLIENILVAKLRPGQEIHLQAHCFKGIGKTHAKWSPVATASYRLMPEITLLEDVTGDSAYKLAECFSPGVIAVENGKAVVKAPRNDTISREVFRHPEFEGKVRLSRLRDYFIFNVESVGVVPPQILVEEALKGLIEKVDVLLEAFNQLETGSHGMQMWT